jgi:hypothetical protein
MVLKVFSIHDQKAEAYNTPFFQKTKGEALRNFTTGVNDPKTTLNQYPEDFDLWEMGDWDDQTGKFEPYETPKHIAKAIEMLDRPTA